MRPTTNIIKQIIESIDHLVGTVFPMRVGNRFSFEAQYRYTYSQAHSEDQETEAELCEVSQQFDAHAFHPDLTGQAFLLNCQERHTYKIAKTADSVLQWRTIFFEELGVPLRVDPQDPPQKIIQTYFENQSTETARLQSFILAR